MVWSVQNDRPATGRDSARKDRRSQDCESERGRESESLVQVQYPGDPGSTLFQERPATGSGHRGYQQERSAQPPRSAPLILAALVTLCNFWPKREPKINRFAFPPRMSA